VSCTNLFPLPAWAERSRTACARCFLGVTLTEGLTVLGVMLVVFLLGFSFGFVWARHKYRKPPPMRLEFADKLRRQL